MPLMVEFCRLSQSVSGEAAVSPHQRCQALLLVVLLALLALLALWESLGYAVGNAN